MTVSMKTKALAAALTLAAVSGRVDAQSVDEAIAAALAKAKPADGLRIAMVPVKNEVTLGEDMVVRVAVANADSKKLDVNALILDELSITFQITFPGGRPFEYSELLVDPLGDRLTNRVVSLEPGKDTRQSFSIPTVVAGDVRVKAIYFGFGDSEGSGYSSDEISVTIKPASDGSTALLASLETDAGTFAIAFAPEVAPNTVLHFARLARSGFYDGTVFHRIEPQFVVQGGDPKGNGTGGPNYTLRAEFSDRKHVAGSVAMARTPDDEDSAGSQFYVTLTPQPSLDGQYTVFGEVASGFDVIQKMAEKPQARPVLKKATLVSGKAKPSPQKGG